MPANMKKAGIKYQKGGSLLKKIFGGKKKKTYEEMIKKKRAEEKLKNIKFEGTTRSGDKVKGRTLNQVRQKNEIYNEKGDVSQNYKRKFQDKQKAYGKRVPDMKYDRKDQSLIRKKKDMNAYMDGGPVYNEKGMKVPGMMHGGSMKMKKAQSGFEGPGGGFMNRLRNEGVGSAMKGSFPGRVAGVIGDEYGDLGKRAIAGVKGMVNPSAGPMTPSANDGMYGNTTDQMSQQSMSAKKYGGSKKMYKKGGSFPDMNKDGQITQADIFLKKKQKGTIKKYGGSKKYKSGGAVGPHGVL